MLGHTSVRTLRSSGAGAISSGEQSINIASLRDWLRVNKSYSQIKDETNLALDSLPRRVCQRTLETGH